MEKAERFDAAKYLDTAESVAAYLNAAIEDGDANYLKVALGTAARAKGMTEVARATGLTRDGLYKALCASGNPSYETVLKVLAALGLKVEIKPAAATA